MKLREFLRSKRTWTIITLGVLETAHALLPGYVPDLGAVLRSFFAA